MTKHELADVYRRAAERVDESDRTGHYGLMCPILGEVEVDVDLAAYYFADNNIKGWCLDCQIDPIEDTDNCFQVREQCKKHRFFWREWNDLMLLQYFFNITEEDLK